MDLPFFFRFGLGLVINSLAEQVEYSSEGLSAYGNLY